MSWNREEMKQRLAGFVERLEPAARVAAACPEFDDGAAPADGWHVVAGGATGPVERRAEPLVGRLDFEEVVQAKAKGLEFNGRDARQRAARSGSRLCQHERAEQHRDGHANGCLESGTSGPLTKGHGPS